MVWALAELEASHDPDLWDTLSQAVTTPLFVGYGPHSHASGGAAAVTGTGLPWGPAGRDGATDSDSIRGGTEGGGSEGVGDRQGVGAGDESSQVVSRGLEQEGQEGQEGQPHVQVQGLRHQGSGRQEGVKGREVRAGRSKEGVWSSPRINHMGPGELAKLVWGFAKVGVGCCHQYWSGGVGCTHTCPTACIHSWRTWC